MATREHETVLASIWAEDTEIAMVLFKKIGKVYQPLESWKSNLAVFNFGFIEVLENWKTEHGLNQAIMNQPQNYQGIPNKHPILALIPVSAKLKPAIEPIEGLACLHSGIRKDTIDFSQYSKERLLEQVKRLDEKRDPLVMAFLQGITAPAGGGYAPSKPRDSAPA